MLDNKEIPLDSMQTEFKGDTTQYLLFWNTYFWGDDSTHILIVEAMDNTGFKQKSSSVNVIITPFGSYPIQHISPENNITIRNNNQINFIWSKLNLASKYEIQISKDFLFNEIVLSPVVQDTSYLATNLEQGIYFWRVKAGINDTLWGGWSQPWGVAIDGPVTPKKINPAANDITYNPTGFLWHSSEYATAYEIQVFKTVTPYTISYSSVVSDTTTSFNLDLAKYYWKIRAVNSIGFWSKWSDSTLFANGIFTKKLNFPLPSSTMKVVEREDSGFIILNGYEEPKLIGVSSTGNVEWQTEFTAFETTDIIAGDNNNFIIVGNPLGPLTIAEVSSKGNINWVRNYPDTSDVLSRDIARTRDGGYIIASAYCDCYPTQTTYHNPVIFKLDAGFNLEWESVLSDSAMYAETINETPDNGFIYFGVGSYDIYNTSTVFIRTDNYGNVVWERMWNYWNQPADGISTSDNNYISVGSSPGTAIWQKVNTTGNTEWYVQYFNNSGNANSIVETDDNNYLIAGHGNNNNNDNIFLIKIDESGNALWEKRYPGYFGFSLIKTKDGGYCLIGTARNSSGIMIIKTDSEGETFVP